MKLRILKIYAQFTSEVDPDMLGDYLKQEDVISIENWQKITAQKFTAKEKCRAVLDFLLSSDHPLAFLVIRKALQKDGHYQHILDIVAKEDGRPAIEANAFEGEYQRTRQRSSTISSGQWISRRITQFEHGRCSQEKSVLLELQTEFHEQHSVSLSRPESINSRLARHSARYRELQLQQQQLESESRKRTDDLDVKLMAKIYEVEHKQRTDSKGNLHLKLQQGEEELLKQRENYEKQLDNYEKQREKYEKQLSVDKELIEQLRQKLEEQTKEHMPKKVTPTCQYKSSSQLINELRTTTGTQGKWIRGMTILAKELFLLHGESSAIEVYDSDKFKFIRTMSVNEKDSAILLHITSCNRNNCIYIISDSQQHTRKDILRVNSSGQLIKAWSTCGDNGRLSVAYDANVIMAVFEKNLLNEYTPEGHLIRKIQLSSDAGIVHPWHAIKLVTDRYLVSHGSHSNKDPLHRVCVVDDEGHIRLSFGGEKGHTERRVDSPKQLIVDGNGYIIVNDSGNARMLLLNPNLDFVQELVSKETGHLRNSRCILLDEKNGRLLVADNEANHQNSSLRDGRILVFKAK